MCFHLVLDLFFWKEIFSKEILFSYVWFQILHSFLSDYNNCKILKWFDKFRPKEILESKQIKS